MTELLAKAFERVSQLPPEEQDGLAHWLMEELEDEARWTESFAKSPSALSTLADQALEDLRQGRTKPLDSETL